MPEISRFFGISIKMFFGEHLPPHFHAEYGEFKVMFGWLVKGLDLYYKN